ncbi:MAG TPA: hypothetical protein VGR25_02790 [bacterium]|jgi:hypothetical protein|nr:hypothetical protein [bacterium]
MQTVGTFRGSEVVDCVAAALRRLGIDPGGLSLVVKEDTGPGETRPEADVSAGTATETVKGSVIGGIAGLVVGTATAFIPGVGLIVAAGPIATGLSALAAALSGGVAGASVGALVGLVSKLGIPEADAEEYASELERRSVMALEHDGTHDVAAIFRECGCQSVRNYRPREPATR